jgi:hypothetical protein
MVQARYQAARDSLGRVYGTLPIPPLERAAGGPVNAVDMLRADLLARTGNPLHQAVDSIVDDVLRTASARLLQRGRPRSELEAFASQQVTPATVDQSVGLLTPRAVRAGGAYAALPPAARVEVVRALQFEVRRALSSGSPAALRRIGADAQAAAASVDEIARGVDGAVRLVRHVNALDVSTMRTVRDVQQRISNSVGDLQQAVSSAPLPRDMNVIARTTATLAVAADVLRAVEPARRLAERAQVISTTIRDAQSLATRAQTLAQESGQLIATTQGYLSEGKSLLGATGALAATFNIPTTTINRAKRTIETARAAIGIATSLASGNVLGAIGAVGGLFGGGGPDQAELRHQELLKEFEKVNKRLDELQRGQQRLMEQVAALDRRVDELAAQVARNHAEVMTALGDVNRNVLWVGRLVIQDDISSLDACKQVTRFYEQDSYRGRRDFAQNFPGDIRLCEEALARLSVDPMQGTNFARILWLDAYDTTGVEARRYSRAVVKPVRDYFLDTWLPQVAGSNPAMHARLRGALASPSFTLASLSEKLHRLRSGAPDREVPVSVLTHPVQDSAVVEFAKRVLDLHGVQAFFTNGAIRPEAAYFDPGALPLGARYLPGEFQLHRALEIVDYAVAQQTLLSGDVMLHHLSEMFFDPALATLTEGNVVLDSNVMRYAIYEIAEQPGSAFRPQDYEAALESSDPTLMLGLMTRVRGVNGTVQRIPLPVRRMDSTGEYEMRVGQRWLTMPSAEEFRGREFAVSAPLQRLIATREALLDVIAGYEMVRRMSPQERARYYRLALIH